MGFCIDYYGKTADIHVVGDDPDPAMSEVVRQSVAGWRFKPFAASRKGLKTCTECVVQLEFE